MLVHKVETALDGRLVNYGIRIKQQHVFGLRLANGLIVGTRKTHIILIGYEAHLRMFGAQRLNSSITRIVVDNINVANNTLKGTLYTLQTLVQQLADIIADDDYADFLGHTNGMQSNKITPR